MKLPQIRQDRANHFIYGFVIYIIASVFFIPLISFLITAIIALGKELYDEYDYGGFDIKDLIFTITAPLILLILQIIKHNI